MRGFRDSVPIWDLSHLLDILDPWRPHNLAGDTPDLPEGGRPIPGRPRPERCLTEMRRGVYRLRIVCCDAYPGLMDECEAAILAMKPPGEMVVGRVRKIGCTEMAACWKHWPCLFPQHGPGRKHDRSIVMEPWQEEILHRHPSLLLRGLIHSDGWRGTNRVTVRGKRFEYPRYNFSNKSLDIQEIFCRAADRFGVSWRQMNDHAIAVSKRSEVAKLDEVVGPKY